MVLLFQFVSVIVLGWFLSLGLWKFYTEIFTIGIGGYFPRISFLNWYFALFVISLCFTNELVQNVKEVLITLLARTLILWIMYGIYLLLV